ncbi:MAG: efflux RND transporter permease subunit [Gammaproteobacteria bacterium]|nr:efflux RND transporter permease subunit [Gammaproteobacteria bacterium]
MLQRLIQHHVLVNLAFALVLVMGTIAYLSLPRQQDPEINFNWIQITTFLPGASAEEVEKRLTDPLEEAIRKVSDIRFVASSSRNNVSNILVRFEELEEHVFDKRVTDLRREVQNKAEEELPKEAERPFIFEITTGNAYPTAMVLVTSPADDENLRRQAHNIKKDLEKLQGVDSALPIAMYKPELHVNFLPEHLEGLDITPVSIADTVIAHFRDISAGSVDVGDRKWLVRLLGTDIDPDRLAALPILGATGEVLIGDVAEVVRGRGKPTEMVRYQGRPAVLFSITKKARANTLKLVERVNAFITKRNRLHARTGVELVLLDDSTIPTREALTIMQRNALIGLVLVLLVTWTFLGSRIAILTSIGIPFILAGTFWTLSAMGETLNNSVLIGVVIVLGMLVDDAVVVVESIYHRLLAGMDTVHAAIDSLREVAAPVTSAVLTTMAAFLPLMLLPGILGKFMLVIPVVVTIALAISLVEAFWMLPAHLTAFRVGFSRPSRVHRYRIHLTHMLQIRYTRLLVKVLRRPSLFLVGVLMVLTLAGGAVYSGAIRIEFFAFDPMRLFYINVEMHPGTSLEKTMVTVQEAERRARRHIVEGELRAMAGYSGQMYTEMEPLFGDNLGQIFVSLNPRREGVRPVSAVVEAMRQEVAATPGVKNISFTELSGGPPTAKPIKVKVRGDDFATIDEVAKLLKGILGEISGVKDITDDTQFGGMELALRIDQDALRRSRLDPAVVTRTLTMLADGERVASFQHAGEEVEVRVQAKPGRLADIEDALSQSMALPGGGQIRLGSLLHTETGPSRDTIRHYDYRRAITVEANLDKAITDTVTANGQLLERWEQVADRYPSINLDFSGELDDINEALDAMPVLLFLGLGLIYLVLGTQFRSYFQPFMIIATIPMATTGVILGLLVTHNPASLYTMYGVVAMIGISVNAAIMLITAANQRLEMGMTVLHATLYSARRRVIPILITTLTTIAGLFSLATGLGGESLIWGPVATAIVWGLGFSTILTLFVIPLLYRLFMGRKAYG